MSSSYAPVVVIAPTNLRTERYRRVIFDYAPVPHLMFVGNETTNNEEVLFGRNNDDSHRYTPPEDTDLRLVTYKDNERIEQQTCSVVSEKD